MTGAGQFCTIVNFIDQIIFNSKHYHAWWRSIFQIFLRNINRIGKKLWIFLTKALARKPSGAILTSVKNGWIVTNFIYIFRALLSLLDVFTIFILFGPRKVSAIQCWSHTRIALNRKNECINILSGVKNL